MTPFIREGDVVAIDPAAPCRVGDIILWERGEDMVLHRLVVRKKGWFLTKGDASGHLDAPVTGREILGRAVTQKRAGRVRKLDSFWARFSGLAFSLMIPRAPQIVFLMGRLKRLGQEMFRLENPLPR